MPLNPIMCSVGRNLPSDIQDRLRKLLASVDQTVSLNAQSKQISMKNVRIVHPLNYLVYVSVNNTIILATDKNVGTPTVYYLGNTNAVPYNKQQLIKETEMRLGFEDIFTIEFPTAYLFYKDDNEKNSYSAQIAKTYLENVIYEISVKDKKMIQKSIFSCNEFIIDDKLVFVVCPFKDEFNAIYEDHIKKVVIEELSMNCLRADEIYSNRPIIDDIWKLINEAKVIVADLTERNPNVFYEVGLAHAIGKEVILLAQSVEDIPFDLRHLRTIIYKNDYRGQTVLHETLRKTITAIVH